MATTLHRYHVPSTQIVQHDLCLPLNLGRRFDVAVRSEVVEHVEPPFAAQIILTLVLHADVIWFSVRTSVRARKCSVVVLVALAGIVVSVSRHGLPLFTFLQYSTAQKLGSTIPTSDHSRSGRTCLNSTALEWYSCQDPWSASPCIVDNL